MFFVERDHITAGTNIIQRILIFFKNMPSVETRWIFQRNYVERQGCQEIFEFRTQRQRNVSAAEYSEILLAKRTSVNEDQTRLETRGKKGIILRAWKIGDRDLLEETELQFVR